MSASAPQATTSGSRSRTQARKKPNDDAAYFAPLGSSASAKRHAADRAEGEPRVKRKRIDQASGVSAAQARRDAAENEKSSSSLEFVKMPTAVLHRYLAQYDIVPYVYPSPTFADDPPPPSSLENPFYHASRPPSPPLPLVTPANRPRREAKDQSRRRSSRLLEEENRSRTPIQADLEEIHVVLARIVERHFREMLAITGREEVDTLASFMCAVEKAKGGRMR